VSGHATNMVFASVAPEHSDPLGAYAKEQGLMIKPVYGAAMRLVTHLDVSQADIDRTIAIFKSYFAR